MEWAGAFGDLGTLIPFVVGYIGVLKMDPFGILFAFGVAMLLCGSIYKTPFPVQPMKAIAAIAIAQVAQTAVVTPMVVYAAGLTTGLLWLVLGVSGMASRITKFVPRPVVVGIILGLGMSFMLNGVKMMASHWLLAAVGLVGTLLLLTNRKIPAMFLLLIFGAISGAILHPAVLHELGTTDLSVRAPHFELSAMTWHDLLIGFVLLTLPQLPLTLGNAVIAIREENNRLFPDRTVTDNRVATSTGLMNIASSVIGGVPMCHGAGGMAGHVAFGARTGGALIILGLMLLLLAIFFSNSIATLFHLFPTAILGVILFLAGAQLALGACNFGKNKVEHLVTLITAAFAMWDVGVAFVVGMTVSYLGQRGWLKL
ncbi:MAG: sulfate transporter [Gammaproteobacteria bacterium]|nr:sulfate transporter [Gammaproteobacteria bacterium]